MPVLFSNDGSHSVYIGQQGDEHLVVEDGKEVGPMVPSGMANMTVQMSFSPGGEHLIYMMETSGSST